MISLIIFFAGVFIIYPLNIYVFWDEISVLKISWIFPTAVIGMILVNAIVAIICTKVLPDKWFIKENKFFSASKKETLFYDKLKIKKWKDKTLELGALNHFKKDKIHSTSDPAYVEKFIIENNKGFLDHFVSIFAGFAAIFIMPKKFWLPMALPIAITSFLINLLSVVILRYNMPRLRVLLKFAQRNANKDQAIDNNKDVN